mgnify:CR=1 FL=1
MKTFNLNSTSSTIENVNSDLSMTLIPGDKHIGQTDLIIQALKTQGTTSLMTSASVTTMNNRIAPIQVSTDESYVEKIETTLRSYIPKTGYDRSAERFRNKNGAIYSLFV